MRPILKNLPDWFDKKPILSDYNDLKHVVMIAANSLAVLLNCIDDDAKITELLAQIQNEMELVKYRKPAEKPVEKPVEKKVETTEPIKSEPTTTGTKEIFDAVDLFKEAISEASTKKLGIIEKNIDEVIDSITKYDMMKVLMLKKSQKVVMNKKMPEEFFKSSVLIEDNVLKIGEFVSVKNAKKYASIHIYDTLLIVSAIEKSMKIALENDGKIMNFEPKEWMEKCKHYLVYNTETKNVVTIFSLIEDSSLKELIR
jgi:hypothetical protein